MKENYRMINVVGLVILILGFIAPYISNGRLPSVVFFWIGGLMVLNKGVFLKPDSTWTKWARIGILINIAFFVVMLATFFITNERSMTAFGHWLSMIPYWLSKPATALGQQIFPFSEVRHPDGSVTFHMGFTRTVIADFLDVGLFASVAVAIGLFWKKVRRPGRAERNPT
jgi:hypothetical protein